MSGCVRGMEEVRIEISARAFTITYDWLSIQAVREFHNYRDKG